MYKERMLGYYPQVIREIFEFQAIIDAESEQMQAQSDGRDAVMNQSYLPTMGETRIKQWEKALGITPIQDSSLEDRRDTIVARIRGQGKLNEALISSIVNAFTGGKAKSWVENSTLYVEITPPPGNKQYQFANVEQELNKKLPAHLGLSVNRNHVDWNKIKTTFTTWQNVKDSFDTWEDVYLYIPQSVTLSKQARMVKS